MPNKKRRAAAKKKQKKSFLSFLLSLLGAAKSQRPATKRLRNRSGPLPNAAKSQRPPAKRCEIAAAPCQTAAKSQRPQETYRPRPQQSKPALTPGQMAYINARKVTFDQLMKYGHKETDVLCDTEDLRAWAVGLYPGQELSISSYNAPERLAQIVRYKPYSQFFCVSVQPGPSPVVRVAVNEIGVYNAAEEADTSFPAIPPDVPPLPDQYGRPTQGIGYMDQRLQFRPNDPGRKLLQPAPGVFYPRGTQLSLRRYPQGVAVQDGPAFLGFLDFNEEQLVAHYGIRACRCYVASCTGTDIYVYVLK